MVFDFWHFKLVSSDSALNFGAIKSDVIFSNIRVWWQEQWSNPKNCVKYFLKYPSPPIASKLKSAGIFFFLH